jgi:DNA polymerase III subunit delta'
MTDPTGPAGDDAVDALDRDALDTVVGQPEALALLRASLARPVHAYLFLGPAGSGKRQAARAFAAELLASGRRGQEAERQRRLALAETHPDLEVVEREGASISRDQVRWVVEQAVRSPVEGARKILLLTEFHLVTDAAPILLKSVEEPSPSTVFLILADELPPELATIASRCVIVPFRPLATDVVVEQLVAEGVAPDAAVRAAGAAAGDLARARILTTDSGLEARAEAWRSVPERLDGRGNTVSVLVAELTAQLDEALGPLDARHRTELSEVEERIERYGLARGVLRTTEDRHKRERRKFRTDELRFGLAVLARASRDRLAERLSLAAPGAAGVAASGRIDVETTHFGRTDFVGPEALEPFAAVQTAAEALERNPNEALLLEALLLRLRPLD